MITPFSYVLCVKYTNFYFFRFRPVGRMQTRNRGKSC